MKKIPAILFFIIYLFSSTELHQLLKLPLIFEHFTEHRQEDKQISFLAFLKIHYLNAPVNDKDHDKDMQLPFKTTGDCISAISPAFVPALIQHAVIQRIEISKEKILLMNDPFIYSSFLSIIWQPPRNC